MNARRADFSENLRASLFNDVLSNEPTFIQTHLAYIFPKKVHWTTYPTPPPHPKLVYFCEKNKMYKTPPVWVRHFKLGVIRKTFKSGNNFL
jgi:hypothetical protein